ncbi:MAG: hypothetical protein ACREEM_39795, partial [Blastocatellia bacterium]
ISTMSEITVETLLDQFELLPAVEQKRLFAALVQKRNGEAKQPEEIDHQKQVEEEAFQSLAAQWRRETQYWSSVSKMALHPAYQRIIGMGNAAVPFILKELELRGGHWLWALHAITREDPAPPDANFRDAVDAWLRWGRQKGFLA